MNADMSSTLSQADAELTDAMEKVAETLARLEADERHQQEQGHLLAVHQDQLSKKLSSSKQSEQMAKMAAAGAEATLSQQVASIAVSEHALVTAEARRQALLAQVSMLKLSCAGLRFDLSTKQQKVDSLRAQILTSNDASALHFQTKCAAEIETKTTQLNLLKQSMETAAMMSLNVDLERSSLQDQLASNDQLRAQNQSETMRNSETTAVQLQAHNERKQCHNNKVVGWTQEQHMLQNRAGALEILVQKKTAMTTALEQQLNASG